MKPRRYLLAELADFNITRIPAESSSVEVLSVEDFRGKDESHPDTDVEFDCVRSPQILGTPTGSGDTLPDIPAGPPNSSTASNDDNKTMLFLGKEFNTKGVAGVEFVFPLDFFKDDKIDKIHPRNEYIIKTWYIQKWFCVFCRYTLKTQLQKHVHFWECPTCKLFHFRRSVKHHTKCIYVETVLKQEQVLAHTHTHTTGTQPKHTTQCVCIS